MNITAKNITRIIPNGKIAGSSYDLGEIQIGTAISTFDCPTSFTSSNSKDIVRLHFGLKGDYKFSYKQLNKSYDLIGGHFNLMYSPTFDIEVENKTNEIETVGINFSPTAFIKYTKSKDEKLIRFAAQIAEGKSCIYNATWGRIPVEMEALFYDIKNCPFKGNYQEMFLESRAIELTTMAIELLSQQPRKDIYSIVKKEKEKLIAARDFINENIETPPRLSTVSRQVQLNEFKLKHGFKEMFGTTLFGYVSERRWQLAKRYLLDTEKTAAQIAEQLGFATPQHFNNRFKNHFGTTPDQFRKNPDYAIKYKIL